jgi:sugar O-acyltransferase (sialic acid O-acetyltransferase NeuD family)
MSKFPDRLRLVMLGAGGHAGVLHSLLVAGGHQLAGVCDPGLDAQGVQFWNGVPVLGADDALLKFFTAEVGLINGLGQLVGDSRRQALFRRFSGLGYIFPPLVHPAAWVAPGVVLEPGVQVMAGAVIQPNCTIGANTIVNTRAGIDHDCRIGAHVHIAPGATLCGGVAVADGAFVGAGATIIQGIAVGAQAVIGAGATVVRNVSAAAQVLGAPVRLHHQHPQSI